MMFTYVFNQVVHGFRRSWILYLANTLSIFLIVLLYAYMDGSRRELALQSTVFEGELFFHLKDVATVEQLDNVVNELESRIPAVDYISKKIRTTAQYFLPGNSVGNCELFGVDFSREKKLRGYLTLQSGTFPKESRELLIPSSLYQKADFKIGDLVRVIGKTSGNLNNSSRFKIVGVYNAPNFNLFGVPKFITSYQAMESFFQPEIKDVEFGVFFKGSPPEDGNKLIVDVLVSEGQTYAENPTLNRVSFFDLQNISVQFNIFLLIMIIITIFVIITVVFLVNFNVFMIILRRRRRELGTLMAFGVRSRVIGLSFFLETVTMVALSLSAAFLMCVLVAWIGSEQRASGSLEILFVLLSGTNRVDFFLQPMQFVFAGVLVLTASFVAQIQSYMQLSFGSPQDFLSRK